MVGVVELVVVVVAVANIGGSDQRPEAVELKRPADVLVHAAVHDCVKEGRGEHVLALELVIDCLHNRVVARWRLPVVEDKLRVHTVQASTGGPSNTSRKSLTSSAPLMHTRTWLEMHGW